MRRPVWHLELVRDTNAPLEAVAAALSDGKAYHRWHPRLKRVDAYVQVKTSILFEMEYTLNPCFGVEERGIFEVRCLGDRQLLRHRAQFKGWPSLILMGWWRLRSHRMWERLVRSL